MSARLSVRRWPQPGQYLCTRLTRINVEGDHIVCDVIIHFAVCHITPGDPGCRTRRNGDPGWPAEPAEYEFAVSEFEFDGGVPDDAPGPFTEAEKAELTAWFEAHYEDACERVDDSYAYGPDPDSARDRRNEERDDTPGEWLEAAQ